MNDPKMNPRRPGLLQVGGVISPTRHAGADVQRRAEPGSSGDSALSFLVESPFIFFNDVVFLPGMFL